MTETLANGYSSDSSQRGLSYEYPDDLVRMIFIIFCILVHLTKEATALEGLKTSKSNKNGVTGLLLMNTSLSYSFQKYAFVRKL